MLEPEPVAASRSHSPDLADLVAAAKRGSTRAKERLLRSCLPRIRAYVRLRLPQEMRDLESCSDVVQSTCREVLQGLESLEYRGPGAFHAWLGKVAGNKLVSRQRFYGRLRRERKREGRLEDVTGVYASVATPSADANHAELLHRVESILASLPQGQREAAAAVWIFGLSREEAALELDRSVTAVNKLVARARATLAVALADLRSEDE